MYGQRLNTTAKEINKSKMINWTFEEIKKKFENKDYFIRSNFIDEYDFNDDFIDYYKSFIISFNYQWFVKKTA